MPNRSARARPPGATEPLVPTESAGERFERIRVRAVQLDAALALCVLPSERVLLLLHALTRSHLEGMDAATAICNDAIDRVVLRRAPEGTLQ